MQVVHDETFCGPLCQHPSCWQSQRRCQRGLPRTRRKSYDSDSEDEGLPTQKVVNLLDDYGEDSRDRYPAKWRGRPMHERAGSMANLTRAQTRESFPKVRAPNATPASAMRLATLSGQGNAPKPMHKVEVQEVFDLDDLQSDWHETFQAKKYYVWVPNARKKKTRTPLDPMERGQSRPESRVSIKQMSQGPRVLNPKDMTEDMVPEELEIERMNEMMRKERRYDCKTPTGGQPYSYPLTQGGDYNGLYDLLDLPREVLADIVNHIEDRELKSKHQFVEAVIRTLPKLEKNHTAIALASSSVLLQRPIKLLHGDLRNSKGAEPFTSKQVYQLDDSKVLDRLSTANEPPASQRHTDRSVDNSTQREPPNSTHSQKETPPTLNKKKPLPAIGGTTEGEAEQPKDEGEEKKENEEEKMENEEVELGEDKRKIPSIALGLPTIPTGLRYTKTFTYNQQDFDFTLCPIPSPLQAIMNMAPGPGSPSPAPAPSPSSLQGIAPTVGTTGQDEAPPGQEERPRENTTTSFFTEIMESLPGTPWNHPSVTQMVVHMPKTPNATPVTRQSTYLTDGDMAFTPDLGKEGPSAPPTTPRGLTIVSQKSLALTPDTNNTGALQPIAETADSGAEPRSTMVPVPPPYEEMGTIRHQMPRRLPHSRTNPHRTVHFAPSVPPDPVSVPPQPPSSPNESDEVSASPLAPWQMAQAQAAANQAAYAAYARQEAEALMVIGKGTKGTGPVGSGYLQSRGGPAPSGTRPPHTASTASPEPWPQVDEEAYRQSLPRTPSSPPKSAKSALSEVNLELQNRTPDASGRGSYPARSAASTGSRDSTLAAKRIWHEGQMDQLESPAPPPPSPEPRDMHGATTATTTSSSKSPTKSPSNPLGMVAEVEEADTESPMTISAKPPSYLDSISRIPSPRSQSNTRDNTFISREPTGVMSRESTDGDIASRQHGQWAQREMEKQANNNQPSTSQQQQATRSSLDQFDATEATLKQELESEYEKLAKQL